MQTFGSAREAKEFLVSCIIAEAQCENVPLSEVEVKMMYFSETDWTLPNMETVSDAFDRDYDEEAYEQKVGALAHSFCDRARRRDQKNLDAWRQAVRFLQTEDHYLLVLIAGAGRHSTSWIRLLKLSAIGFVLACVVLSVGYLLLKR